MAHLIERGVVGLWLWRRFDSGSHMRRVSREVAQLLERRVETGEGFVEHAGQPAEFVVGILYRKSCVQGFRSDLARGVGHGLRKAV